MIIFLIFTGAITELQQLFPKVPKWIENWRTSFSYRYTYFLLAEIYDNKDLDGDGR